MRTAVLLCSLLLCGCEAFGVSDARLGTPTSPADPSASAGPPPPSAPPSSSPAPTAPGGTGQPATDPDAGPPDAPPDAGPPDAGNPLGVLVRPRLGELFDGDVSQLTLTVAGVSTSPGEWIAIEALGAPYDASGWKQLAQVRADLSPGSGAEADGYPFSIDVQPGADWLQGGVYSLRARDSQGRLLSVFEHDADDCAAQHPGLTWLALAAPCASEVAQRVVVVSTTSGPADQDPPPQYLVKKGVLSTQDTDDYYAAINAPGSLADFRSTFGFDQPSEATAVFYNEGDLGIGREMHCAPLSPGLACYVRNYGTFGGSGDDALAAAVGAAGQDGAGSFAAVAMAYQPGAAEPITFMVYGADGALADSAQLDTRGDNTSVPNNCLACHGLDGAYDAAHHHVTGASFLAFNPSAFRFADQAPFRLVDQLGQLQVLNQWVRGAGTSGTLGQLIGTDYLADAVQADGSLAAVTTVPAGWQGVPGAARVYREVVQPSCQGCHATRATAGGLTFSTAADFAATASSISKRVCGTPGDTASHDMPNAEVPLRRLWSGRARAYLVAWLDLPNPCAP